jgi:hypothetical protein
VSSDIVARLAEVGAGVVALGILLRRLGRPLSRRGGSPFVAALMHRNQPAPETEEFASIRRTVDAARFSAFDVHFTLRPLLRELAASRLWVRRGIKLDAQPELASVVLGSETMAFLREGRPPPPNYRRPVMGVQAIERIVKSLESI